MPSQHDRHEKDKHPVMNWSSSMLTLSLSHKQRAPFLGLKQTKRMSKGNKQEKTTPSDKHYSPSTVEEDSSQ